MTPVRVIGIGSPLGDDQAGWWVIDALARSRALPRLARTAGLVKLDRPGARLIEQFDGAEVVILVDAVKSGAAPGTIHRIDTRALIDTAAPLSSHGFGVAAALALARALDALPPTLWLYGIEIETATGGAAPTDAVRTAVAALAAKIGAELEARFGHVAREDKRRPPKRSDGGGAHDADTI